MRWGLSSSDEDGQITVFLSLSFLVFLSLVLCVLSGIHGHMESALAEEAATEAGNEILANYDRYLFQKYHVFFLDPREKQYLEEDGREFLDHYISSGLYGFRLSSLSVTQEKSAVDEKGLFLRHQINEYMRYRQPVLISEGLKDLMESSGDFSAHAVEEKDFTIDEGGHSGGTGLSDRGETGESEKGDSKSGEEKEEIPAKEKAARQSWRTLKKELNQILHSGVLAYAAEHPGQISSLSISPSGLPSLEASGGGFFRSQSLSKGFSWNRLSEWRSYLHNGDLNENGRLHMVPDTRLHAYLFECFSRYGKEDGDEQTALKYELEYLAAGRYSDAGNLRDVADRIMQMRFLVNYSYASRDPGIQAETESMALLLSGTLGLPEATEAVKVLLVAAISYGESLLELHALLNGEKVAAVKNSSNWNLSFADAPSKLASRASVHSVKNGIGYEDYLMLFLFMKSSENSFLYRMMDIMQVNARLYEPDFTMKDSLFSFSWDIRLECAVRFAGYPGPGRGRGRTFPLEMNRFVSY